MNFVETTGEGENVEEEDGEVDFTPSPANNGRVTCYTATLYHSNWDVILLCKSFFFLTISTTCCDQGITSVGNYFCCHVSYKKSKIFGKEFLNSQKLMASYHCFAAVLGKYIYAEFPSLFLIILAQMVMAFIVHTAL